MDRLSDLPLGWTLLAFWCLAMTRSNGAYWIGRGIAAGTSMSRFAKLLDSPLYQRAQAMAARWGVLAVPLSFLTVGVQTFVQISAGVTRMPLRRYLPAVALGSAIWALIYGSIGMAVILAWLETGGHWPPVLLLLAVVTALVVMHRRRRRPANPGSKSRTVSNPSG